MDNGTNQAVFRELSEKILVEKATFLVDATGVTRSTVWRAVDLLDSIGAVRIRKTPQRNYVAINLDRL